MALAVRECLRASVRSRGGTGRRIVATVMGADPVGVWLEVLLVAHLIFNQEDTFESCQQYKCQDDEFKNCMNMQGANPCRDLKLGG